MAKHRRRRPRTSPSRGYSDTGWRARNNMKPVKVPEGPENFLEWRLWWAQQNFWPDGAPSPMDSWPRWHDILYHTRPRRRAEKALEIKAINGRVDLESIDWPLAKKPHKYYW